MTNVLRPVSEELARLHELLAELQDGKVARDLDDDARAREVAKLKTMLAYMEIILHRLTNSVD